MKNNKKVMITVLTLAVVMVGAAVLYRLLGSRYQMDVLSTAPANPAGQGSSQESQPPLTAAPDFTMMDDAGKMVKLSDFFGKPIVVNFWASWCGPCRHEMPEFDKAYMEQGDEVTFLIINMTDGYQETVDNAKDFIRKQGYHFPVYYDTAQDAARVYGVTSLPTTYFINAEGKLVAKAMGAISKETLQQGISMILPAK